MNDNISKAVLWDLDGVLVDSAAVHFLSWRQIMAEHGYDLTQETFTPLFGMTAADTIRALLGADMSTQEIETRKETLFREMLPGRVVALPGALHWLTRLKALGVRQALASSAPPQNIEAQLAVLGTLPYFDTLVSGFGHPGKPDPYVFIESARRLGVAAANCVVIEDSIAGVEAARRAEMRCIAVTNTFSAAALLETGAERALDSLEDLTDTMLFPEGVA